MRALSAGFWMAVGAAVGWHQTPVETETVYQTVIVEVPAEREWAETPYADSLVDWDEHHRQTDCLWKYLQDHFGYEITVDRVAAAAYWTDELGGACEVIGEDDDE